MKEAFREKGIEMSVPFFQSGDSADYKTWENILDQEFTDDIDTVVTHSMGGRTIIEYIIAHQKHIKRLVMVAPGITSATDSVQQFYAELTQNLGLLKNFVEESIIISSQDDIGREGYGKSLADATGALHIEVN